MQKLCGYRKICMCYQSQNCSCSSYCNPLKSIVMYKTYALFLSFGDIYITEGAKFYTSIGSWLQFYPLVLHFCCLSFANFVRKAMDPNNTMQAHNIEVLRRMLAANIEPNGPSIVNTTSKCYSPPQQKAASSPLQLMNKF
ncbi:uncharacterized protein CEXT_643111 [Caerostris extrusa]|uniref:Uncharacterized protein n=1 Tax=Caerostris extrusa TaxID=172846 RepID=A0AAV4Y0Y9_CAEEX|nr:uncharacterized protein CEXT_643111 [Caerostris extrusa]